MLKTWKVLAALAVGALSLTACGGDSDSSSKELKLWHYEGPDSAMGIAWKAAIKEFEASHPGVTVKFEEKGFEQIQKTAPMVLNSDDAPDIMEYNKGSATAGLLAKQGLLTDLSAEVAERGWGKLLSPNIQATAKYDKNGVMGSGKWYGIPNYAEFEMFYYNKDMFKKHGVKVPTNFNEFVAVMDKFVKDGVTPLANAGAEYMAQQYFYQLALMKADRSWVDRYQRYTGKVDFHDPAWTYGAKTFANWVKKGYISKKSSSLKAEDAGTAFEKGEYPMMFSGSWWYGRFEKEIKKFEWGTFLWPDTKLTLGSSGNLWVVPSGSDNKELAYDFIDITMQKKIQNILAKNGGVPVAADVSGLENEKNKKLIENYKTLVQKKALAFYPDWPVPGFYDVLVSNVQKLITGSASPTEVLDDLAQEYQSNTPETGQ